MGCCGRNKTKGKSKTDVTKRNKIEKKTDSINDKTIPIDETQLLKTEPEQSIPIVENLTRIKSPLISSPDYDIDDFIGNISPIKTLNDLQKSVEKNDKPVSIVLFYGRYCPYSKRTMPDLRQWARANQDRIFLYEADVEQALDLAEYYHIRSIPTIMAFEEKNLIAPIWQRTATNVLSSSSSIDESERTDEEFDKSNNLYVILDPPHEKSDHIESVNDMEQEQSNIDLDQMPNQDEENTIDHSLDDVRSNSVISSIQSPYIWNQSTQSTETTSQKSLEESFSEYNGRMISQSTISKTDQSKKKRTWTEYLDENIKPNDYPQRIHLPNCNEIFYEKQFDHSNQSLSSDRFSTLTSEHVHDRNHPDEEICVLYLGPNGTRGFEENFPDKILHPSKLSLLTLKSNLFSE